MQKEVARNWVVMKFGGTSVSSADCWSTICDQAKRHLDEGKATRRKCTLSKRNHFNLTSFEG